MTARIVQLARSPGGVPKHAVPSAQVTDRGLEDDGHGHPKIHGGPNRALCLYSLELIEKLQAEGHPIVPGSTGENVTISGLDWRVLQAGTRLRLGTDVVCELTWTAVACKQIAASFTGGTFKRLDVAGEMRWYCRIVSPGLLRIGQAVELVAT